MPQDEWVISRVFEKTGAGCVAAASGGGKKRPCDGDPEVSSPSSISLPPSGDSCSYEVGAASSHVPCFSMAAPPPSYGRNSLLELLPPPPSFDLMHFAPSASSSSSRFGAFPTLKSLEENLHLPLMFPAAAPPPPPLHGGNMFGDGGVGQWAAMEEQKVCGSELDCMWS